MNKIKKAIHRLFRIACGKKGVYCKKGKGNRFTKGCFLHEMTTMGNFNYVGPGSMTLNAKISNYCSIGPNVKLGQMEHDMSCLSTSTLIFGPRRGTTNFTGYKRETIIENDVWLAANVVVKQGVTIATGAVVGAGAVVTKDIPPYAIAVGVPAKIIGYRFQPKSIEKLLESKWWDLYPEEVLKQYDTIMKEIENYEN
jgi:acetyltransferase-like isoleucine patch superfamily enzyme